jgi:hypothetical protein
MWKVVGYRAIALGCIACAVNVTILVYGILLRLVPTSKIRGF